MFRPLPGNFNGSTPMHGRAEGGLAKAICLGSSALAILCAASVWIGAFVCGAPLNLLLVGESSCAILLTAALTGIWLARKTEGEPQRVTARIYDRVERLISQPGRLAVPHGPTEGLFDGVAGCIGQLWHLARRLQTNSAESERVIALGRAQATVLAAEMRADAAVLDQAAVNVEASSLQLGRELAVSAGALELSDMAMGRAADAVDRLTQRVEATTASARLMTELAVRLSETAHATHRSVAELDGKSAHLAAALEEIGAALRAAVLLLDEPARGDAAGLAQDVRAVTARCQPALAAAQDVLRDLASDAGSASRRARELGDIIGRQHEMGQAIGHAIHQQGNDIRAVLTELYEARSGFATLRDGVDAVTRAGALWTETAQALRLTALRLPSQAERAAQLLRGIPDFSSLSDGP